MADSMVLEAQGNTLSTWEQRQLQWDTLNEKLAKKLGRRPDEMLAANTWKHREKIEKINALEASIPSNERSGQHDWEMSLRGQDGVRYVPLGRRDCPLYLPIKNDRPEVAETKVITQAGSSWKAATSQGLVKTAERTVLDSEYYRTKQATFKKSMTQKYPHLVNGEDEPLILEGTAAPTTTEQVEEEDAVDGFSFRAAPQTSTKSQSYFVEDIIADADAQAAPKLVPESSGAKKGPMLEVARPHLVFDTEPGILSHSSLLVTNVGTTAVFYTWKRRNPDSIVPHHNTDTAERFKLSDVPTGVMLPEEERYFTFSFQNAAAGRYTESWELETVPKGPTSLVITLRGVVVSRDEDPIRRQALEKKINEKLTHAGMHSFFTQILNTQQDNVLEASDAECKAREEAERVQKEKEAQQQAEAERRKQFEFYNSAMGLHYSSCLYEQFASLHRNTQVYLQVSGSPPGSGIGLVSSDGVQLPVQPWSGSITQLSEVIQQVEDEVVRHPLLAAWNDLVMASRFLHPEGEEIQGLVAKHGASPLYAYTTIHNALFAFVDQYIDRTHSLQVQMGMIEEPELPVGGKGGKGGKDAKGGKKKEDPKKKPVKEDPKKAAKGGKGAKDDGVVESEEEAKARQQQEYRTKADQEAMHIMEDVMFQFSTQLETMCSRQQEVAGDFRVTFRTRIEAKEEEYKAMKARKLAEEKEREQQLLENPPAEEEKVEDKKKKKK